MDINSIYSSRGSSLIESVYGENSKNNPLEKSSSSLSSWGEDIVSISTAAKEKLASMQLGETEEEPTDKQAETGTGSGGGSGSSDDSSKLESLKAKLASLQASLSGAVGMEAAGINAQISQIMSEITALQATAA